MNKYDEFMNRIEITPEMRSRLLSGITAAVDENTDDEAVAEQKAEEIAGAYRGRYRLRRIICIAAPLAAAAVVIVLAVIAGSRIFGRKGANGSGSAVFDSVAEQAGGADMDYDRDSLSEEAAEDVAEGAMDFTAPRETEETKTAAETAAVTLSYALETVPYNIFYTNHHIPLTGAEYPSVTLVASRKQLEEEFMTDSYEDPIAAQEFLSEMECSEFTDEFFKTKDVLIILVEEKSGSISHTLTAIERTDTDSPWQIHIRRRIPEIQTEDMAYWYIVAEIEKNVLENSLTEIIFD